MSEKPLNILVFGLGGIGGFFTFVIKRNENVSVSVVARSNYDVVKNNGITIQSEMHGEHQVKVDNVYKEPSEAAGEHFDYILCCHKAVNHESYPALFKDILDDNTTFVIIQNGAGNEDPYRKAYPKCSIISVVTWTAVTQIEPGFMRHIKLEETHLGLYTNPDVEAKLEQERLDGFVDLLDKGGTRYEVHDDVQIPRWEKMIWNAVWNFTSMITCCDSREWRESSDEAETVTKTLMREILEVGRASGVKLEHELIDRWYQKMTDIGGVYGSTYVDMKEGRPMEIEIILGTPLRKAKEVSVEVPTLRALYALSVAINGRIQSGKQK